MASDMPCKPEQLLSPPAGVRKASRNSSNKTNALALTRAKEQMHRRAHTLTHSNSTHTHTQIHHYFLALSPQKVTKHDVWLLPVPSQWSQVKKKAQRRCLDTHISPSLLLIITDKHPAEQSLMGTDTTILSGFVISDNLQFNDDNFLCVSLQAGIFGLWVHRFGPGCNISTTIKFIFQWMNPSDFCDQRILPLAPPAGQIFHLSSEISPHIFNGSSQINEQK